MAADPTGFDSRFDPAFQRGFTGEAAPHAPLVPRETPIAVSTPAAQPPAPDAVDEFMALGLAAASTDDDPDLDSDLNSDDEPRGPNPFLIALSAVSVLLIAGGIYTAQAVSASYESDDLISSLDYVTFNLVIYGVPIAIALGIATGIGVLFVHAVRWNRGGVTRSRSNSRKNEA